MNVTVIDDIMFLRTVVSYCNVEEYLSLEVFVHLVCLTSSILTGQRSLFQILHSVGFQFKNTGEWTVGSDIVFRRTVFLQGTKVSNIGWLPVYPNRHGISIYIKHTSAQSIYSRVRLRVSTRG
jgi:hypothetical protein